VGINYPPDQHAATSKCYFILTAKGHTILLQTGVFMTQQEVYDQLVADIAAKQAQIDAATASIAPLAAARDHEIFLRDHFSFINSLAVNNGLAIDNPKLFQCYDVAFALATSHPDANMDFNDLVASFFHAIAPLIAA
jgi:hypothetical protein